MAFLLLYIIIKAELLYEVFGMGKFLKRVFNSVIFNRSITVVFFVIAIAILVYHNKIPILKKFQAIDQYKVVLAMTLIGSFFLFNLSLILKNKHTYLNFFTFVNKWATFFFVIVLIAIMCSYYSILNYKEPSWFSYFYFTAIFFTAWIGCVYLNFCIRLLNSINVKCSVFVATTVKAILIAIVAWLALYKDSETDKNAIINFFVSYISLCYPLLDMYTYVRSEINEFDKQEKIEIETNKIEKKQFNDVEEFVKKLGTKNELNKLKNKIKKRKKKLKKERFSDSKRFVNKFATLEDLDNLEKSIAEKREELDR